MLSEHLVKWNKLCCERAVLSRTPKKKEKDFVFHYLGIVCDLFTHCLVSCICVCVGCGAQLFVDSMCGDGGKRCTLQGEKSPLGLSTDEALRRLSEEIETLVHSYEQKFNNERQANASQSHTRSRSINW